MKKTLVFVIIFMLLTSNASASWLSKELSNLKSQMSTPYQSINENDPESVARGLRGSTREKTIMRVVTYMNANYVYGYDIDQFGVIDYWQTPMEMFLRKIGDCEDSAILMVDILWRNGIESEVWYIASDRFESAHAIVVLRYGNGWAYIDNSYKVHPYETKKEAVMAFWSGQGGTSLYGLLNNLMNKPNTSKMAPTMPVKIVSTASERLKMHSHLTECQGNEIEIMLLPMDKENYSQLVHKEAVGFLAKVNSRVIKAVGFSYSEHGWCSPSREWNNKEFSFHFLFPYVGATFNTGDYQGIDIDVNPISSKSVKAYVNIRNLGQVWDYKAVLTPIKWVEGQVELNDKNLNYGFYLKLPDESDPSTFLKVGLTDKKMFQVLLSSPQKEVSISFGRPLTVSMAFRW